MTAAQILPATPWLSDVAGRAVDLVDPIPEQVDFAAIAHALAHLNRYAGHADQPVSVALHTLIGLDICPEELKAHWLLHDAHETRLGELTRPTKDALTRIGEEARAGFGQVVARTLAEFTRRHDAAIHAAAGVPMPSVAQRQAIAEIDRRCLATEFRDFHRPSERRWPHEIEGVLPLKQLRRWDPPPKVEEQLLLRFQRYLPRLRAGF